MVYIAVLCMVTLCACSAIPPTAISPSATSVPSAAPAQTSTPAAASQSIQEQLNQMSTNEKIGQMVLAGIQGTTMNTKTKALIESYQIGGIIFYKDNLASTQQAVELIHSLKQSNAKNRIPLWLSLDEEGGRVTRLPNELVKFPANQEIGKVNNSKFAFAVGSTMGSELKAYGLNVDFAPVLDINSNPDNPIIGNRSFSPKADIVAKLGIQTMKGLQSQNIVSVVKHFPGHGDTSVDSHIGLPVVQHDLKRLREVELVPFAQAIRNQADAIMVAHILLPKLDAKHPASFSKAIITDLLRKELGFQGVVISDDMTMGAVAQNYEIGEAAVQAVLAGTDVVLVGHDYDKETSVIQALRQALLNKRITIEMLNSSVTRILKLKSKYSITDDQGNGPNVAKLNAEVNQVLKQYVP
jgi:beta-N-acetylhexosaminidase